jgi:hypothetical protein
MRQFSRKRVSTAHMLARRNTLGIRRHLRESDVRLIGREWDIFCRLIGREYGIFFCGAIYWSRVDDDEYKPVWPSGLWATSQDGETSI